MRGNVRVAAMALGAVVAHYIDRRPSGVLHHYWYPIPYSNSADFFDRERS